MKDRTLPTQLKIRIAFSAVSMGVLVLLLMGMTVVTIAKDGKGVGPLLFLAAVVLGLGIFSLWAFRRAITKQRSGDLDTRRRQVSGKVQAIILGSAMLGYLIGGIVVAAVDIDMFAAALAVRIGAGLVTLSIGYLVAKQLEPRLNFWGKPDPMSDAELARHESGQTETRPW